jgi:hypothetical protein
MTHLAMRLAYAIALSALLGLAGGPASAAEPSPEPPTTAADPEPEPAPLTPEELDELEELPPLEPLPPAPERPAGATTTTTTTTTTTETAAPPPPPTREGPYSQGKVRVGLGGGLISSGGDWAFGLSLTAGYYVVDNLEVGADAAFQFGDVPFAAMLGPAVRYLFPVSQAVHPYIGAFYRHWFLSEGIDDVDSVGARAGIVIRSSTTFFQIGAVYEVIVSECDGGCSDIYPEFGVSLVF